ncbi:hypothetical protein [Acidocella sp. KAb 2-4]|nr:hypothetical protein [Acidocella sp. KAb 2-4]
MRQTKWSWLGSLRLDAVYAKRSEGGVDAAFLASAAARACLGF